MGATDSGTSSIMNNKLGLGATSTGSKLGLPSIPRIKFDASALDMDQSMTFVAGDHSHIIDGNIDLLDDDDDEDDDLDIDLEDGDLAGLGGLDEGDLGLMDEDFEDEDDLDLDIDDLEVNEDDVRQALAAERSDSIGSSVPSAKQVEEVGVEDELNDSVAIAEANLKKIRAKLDMKKFTMPLKQTLTEAVGQYVDAKSSK